MNMYKSSETPDVSNMDQHLFQWVNAHLSRLSLIFYLPLQLPASASGRSATSKVSARHARYVHLMVHLNFCISGLVN